MNGCSHSKKTVSRERLTGGLVWKFELRRLLSLDAIQEEPPFFLLLGKENEVLLVECTKLNQCHSFLTVFLSLVLGTVNPPQIWTILAEVPFNIVIFLPAITSIYVCHLLVGSYMKQRYFLLNLSVLKRFCLFYHQMSHNFSEVFKQLVSNGKATLVMKTDPVDQPVNQVHFSDLCMLM